MAQTNIADALARLVAWSAAQGGKLHDKVGICYDPVTKLSLRVRNTASDGLAPGDTVVTCPLSTSLSYLNVLSGGQPLGLQAGGASASADGCELAVARLPAAFLDQTAPHVAARFFLIQQWCLGTRSYWHPYLVTLPHPANIDAWGLPAVWERAGVEDNGKCALSLLDDTNAGVTAAEMRAQIRREFDEAAQLMRQLDEPGWLWAVEPSRFRLHEWAFCIFTSRSFRPTRVLSPEVQASLSGSPGTVAAHPAVNGVRLPFGCGLDDFSILLPVLDLGNHDPRACVSWETKELPAGDNASAAGVAFCTEQTVPVGAQVFNNYGPKTNSELLLAYGFVLPPTDGMHNDYIHLRKSAAAQSLAEQRQQMKAKQRGPIQDFLMSLRPIDDDSSVVGRTRPSLHTTERSVMEIGFAAAENAAKSGKDSPRFPRRGPEFAIVEDELLWDMTMAVAGASTDVRAVMEQYVAVWKSGLSEKILSAPDEELNTVMGSTQALQSAILDLLFAPPEAWEHFKRGGYGTEGGWDLFSNIADQIRDILLVKVERDLEKMEQSNPEGFPSFPKMAAASAQARQLTEREKLALSYRVRMFDVLSTASALLSDGALLARLTNGPELELFPEQAPEPAPEMS